MVKLIWSTLLNPVSLVMYVAKFETFLFDQIFLKIWLALIHQISWMKKSNQNFKLPHKNQLRK